MCLQRIQVKKRKVRISGQADTQDGALEPELPLSTLSPVKPQDNAETKESVLEATKTKEMTEAVEITEGTETTDQRSMKDDGEVIPKLERQECIKRL